MDRSDLQREIERCEPLLADYLSRPDATFLRAMLQTHLERARRALISDNARSIPVAIAELRKYKPLPR